MRTNSTIWIVVAVLAAIALIIYIVTHVSADDTAIGAVITGLATAVGATTGR